MMHPFRLQLYLLYLFKTRAIDLEREERAKCAEADFSYQTPQR